VAGGNLELLADNDVNVEGDVMVDGTGQIWIRSDYDDSDDGDVIVGNYNVVTIQGGTGPYIVGDNNEAIHIEGDNVILGGTNPVAGGSQGEGSATVITVGDGDIKVSADTGPTLDGVYVAWPTSAIHASGQLFIDPLDVWIQGDYSIGDESQPVWADRDIYIDGLVKSTLGGVILYSDNDRQLNPGPDVTTGVQKTTYGDIYIRDTVQALADVSMNSNFGGIFGTGTCKQGGDGYVIAANSDMTGWVVGTLDQSVSVNIGGTLFINAWGHKQGISGVLNGSTRDIDISPTTPGLVLFNCVLIDHKGPLSRAYSAGLAQQNPFLATEVGRVEQQINGPKYYTGGTPYDLELFKTRVQIDVFDGTVYVPDPDLITDLR
jgi:hypothetical protein